MKFVSLQLLFLFFLIVVFIFLNSCGGDPDLELTGSIEGRITNNANGSPVQGVDVVLSGQKSESQTTGSGGIYSFDNLVIGEYTVSINHPDFQANTRDFDIRSIETTEGDIQLTPLDPIELSVTQLDFGTSSSSENFNLVNKRNGELQFSIVTSSNLLTVSPDNGTLAQQNTALIRVGIDRDNLAIGDYTEEIVINSSNTLSGASETLNVLISVLDPSSAELTLSSNSLGYGSDVSTRELEISNTGEDELNWTAGVSESWISISSSSGGLDPTESQKINVNVDRTGLAEGNYEGQVNFSGNGGSSSVTITMEVLGSSASAMMGVSATSFDFGLTETSKELTIENTGEVDLTWDISSTDSWLSTSSSSGTVTPTGSQSINILIDRTSLAEGQYSGTLNVTGNGGDTTISVTMEVPSQDPVLSLSTDELSFGDTDDTRSITVTNTGRQTLNWSLTENEPWLNISSTSGAVSPDNSQDITVTIVRDGLADGTYNTSIDFTGDGGDASVNVIMEVSGQGAGNDADNDGIPDEADADDDGDGLIEIYTINDLDNVRNDLDASGTGLSGAPSGGFTGYELMKNLDFDSDNDYSDTSLKSSVTSSSGWEPIGYNSTGGFNTEFEGNGFTISNLFINRTSDYVALFESTGFLAEIRNLNIEVRYISGDEFVGGLVAYNRADIFDCSVKGEISVSSSKVGLLVGSHEQNTISRCYVEGYITSGSSSIGGLVGRADGFTNGNSWEISNSYAKVGINANSYAGGFIGYIDDTGTGIIKACYATGNVSADGRYCGGFAGWGAEIISDCYALGNATSNSRDVGGFMGYNSRTTINSSYSIGEAVGSSNVGGFAGTNFGSISSTNYWDTETSGLSNSAGSPTGQTTAQLQVQTTASGIYITWSGDVWDFGNASQYPALKNMPGGLNEQRD